MASESKDDAPSAAAEAKKAAINAVVVSEVVVKPLVLLSVVDHYNRVAKDTRKRVVGVLLGEVVHNANTNVKSVEVTNSFAVPFEEDARNPTIWYLDRDYLENLTGMFRKVSAKEKVVGFYSTGPRIREADVLIEQLFNRYCKQPILVIVDVRPDQEGIPTTAYVGTDVIENDATRRSFKHIASVVEASEAEAVGVEHLLRDINDPSVSSLATRVNAKIAALSGLTSHLLQMREYLEQVAAGEIPVNNQIVYNAQVIFNLLPNLNVEGLVAALYNQTNDFYHAVYVAALVRSIIALHNLVANKLQYATPGASAAGAGAGAAKASASGSGSGSASASEEGAEAKDSPSSGGAGEKK